MAQQEVRSAPAFALHSARDAVDELVRLIETVDLPSWSFTTEPLGAKDIDLRWRGDLDVLPIVLPDGSVPGTVRCPARPTGDPTDAALRALVQMLVLLVAMERRGWAAVDRARSAELESRVDSLTGLPNRRLWDEAAAQEEARCRRHGLRALVAVVDLDGLKEANDSHGHLAGDLLLRGAAKALRSAVRDTDLVARVGGDEFAVLAVDFEAGDPAAFGTRLEEALLAAGAPGSVGVTVAEPGTSLLDAFDRADHLMYERKHDKRRSGA